MIQLIKVKDKAEGNLKARDILKEIVDSHTLLALSGGTSPDYRKMIVDAVDIIPGAICVADERYGEPFHKDSNEYLLKQQGIKECTETRCIEAHKILDNLDFETTAKRYNDLVARLFGRFKKKVGVMGVGSNLHTAGIFPNSSALKSPDYVACDVVDDKFQKRITLTLKALGEFTSFVVLMFGSTKQDALRILLDEGENDMQKYPAIFYRKSPAKCWLITDINL